MYKDRIAKTLGFAREEVEVGLNGLNRGEREVLEMRFSGKTLEEVGNIIGFEPEDVRRIEAVAIWKMRNFE